MGVDEKLTINLYKKMFMEDILVIIIAFMKQVFFQGFKTQQVLNKQTSDEPISTGLGLSPSLTRVFSHRSGRVKVNCRLV